MCAYRKLLPTNGIHSPSGSTTANTIKNASTDLLVYILKCLFYAISAPSKSFYSFKIKHRFFLKTSEFEPNGINAEFLRVYANEIVLNILVVLRPRTQSTSLCIFVVLANGQIDSTTILTPKRKNRAWHPIMLR